MTQAAASLLAYPTEEDDATPPTPTTPTPANAAPRQVPDAGTMQGYIAAAATDPAMNYGRLFWFSVREFEAPEAEFQAAAQELLPEALRPGKLRIGDAFGRAVQDLATHKALNGNVPVTFTRAKVPDAEVETHYVTAVLHPQQAPPEYHVLAVLTLNKVETPSGDVRVEPRIEYANGGQLRALYDDLEGLFHDRVKHHATHYSSDNLRGVLNRAITRWNSYLARQTGGVYVTLERHAAELANVQAFTRRFGGQLWAVPLVRTAESRDLILTTYEEQTVKDIEAILPKLEALEASGQVESAEYKALTRQLDRWAASKEQYEAELQATMSKVDLTLTVARDRIQRLLPLVGKPANQANL